MRKRYDFYLRYAAGCGVLRATALALLPGLLGCAVDGRGPHPSRAYVAFVGVDVLTMEDAQLLRDQTVLVGGTRITAIGARTRVGVPRGARLIEAQGRVLMPGLVDAHIHLRHADSTALMESLRAGITCAREMNGRPFILDWRDRINSGELAGPWLHVAAPTLGNSSRRKKDTRRPKRARRRRALLEAFRQRATTGSRSTPFYHARRSAA